MLILMAIGNLHNTKSMGNFTEHHHAVFKAITSFVWIVSDRAVLEKLNNTMFFIISYFV